MWRLWTSPEAVFRADIFLWSAFASGKVFPAICGEHITLIWHWQCKSYHYLQRLLLLFFRLLYPISFSGNRADTFQKSRLCRLQICALLLRLKVFPKAPPVTVKSSKPSPTLQITSQTDIYLCTVKPWAQAGVLDEFLDCVGVHYSVRHWLKKKKKWNYSQKEQTAF